MPQKDPVTGCMVLTMPEFLAAEAAREGKEPHEIMDEISATLRDDEQQTEENMQRPEVALQMLQEWCGMEVRDWMEQRDGRRSCVYQTVGMNKKGKYIYRKVEVGFAPRPFYPIAVLEVISVVAGVKIRQWGSSLLARVRCDDGMERVISYQDSHTAGTRIDPPEHDTEMEWWSPVRYRKWQADMEARAAKVLPRVRSILELKKKAEE